MCIRVLVKSVFVESIPMSGKNGKPDWFMRKQVIWVQLVDGSGSPDPYPSKSNVLLNRDDAPYPIGDYMVSPASFYVGSFDRLELGLKLIPASARSLEKAA